MSLARKTLRGVLWTGMAKFSMQGVLMVVTMILARLLSKDDFGLIGMAALITVALSLINDRGLGTAVVQRTEITPGHLSSLFWGGLLFGASLFAMSLAAAAPISRFYVNPRLEWVIIIFAFDFIVGAFGIVQKSLLTREMDFKKLSIIETASVLASGVISVAIALARGGVWSLVAQTLARDVINVILVWIYCPWRPRRHFSWKEFRELFGFSANVLGNDVAFYLMTNTDVTIIGKLLGSAALGSYSLALNLVKLPTTRLSGVVSKVMFPAFSAVQNDLATFKRAFAKTMSYIALLTFPLLAFVGLFARECVLVFFGAKWLDMVVPLMLLVPMAMLKSVGTIRGSVLMARGKPYIELWWNISYLLPLAGAVYWGTHYGLAGAAVGFSLFYLVTFPIIQTITNRQVGMSAGEFIRALWPASSACGLMALAALGLHLFFSAVGPQRPIERFFIGLVISSGTYAGAVWVFHRTTVEEILTLIKAKKTRPATGQHEVESLA